MWVSLCHVIAMVALGLTGGASDVAGDLLPRPQRIELLDGAWRFVPKDLSFVLRTPSNAAAEALGERWKEVQDRLDLAHAPCIREYPVADTFALLAFSGQEAPVAGRPDLAAGQEGEGYELTVTEKGMVACGATERGLFYGMMTIEQLLNRTRDRRLDSIPCLRIVDSPRLGMRGFHEDYGRDQLPTVADQKRTIRTLAQYKMNTHLWFIEPDHFVYGFDPDIGKEFDRFTFDEIRDVVGYAKKYYIEVIPVVELLAHMENTLGNPKYADLAEVRGSGTLCPTSEESLAFVRKIIGEIAPAFEGRYFHCGLDESAAVGQGQSAEAVKAKGIERVYADYYSRLNDIVKSHGKTMMMYADIVLNHPKVMDLLPEDIVTMYWNYGDAAHHAGLDTLVRAGFQTVSLSAVWDWVNLYPIYAFAFKNIERLAAQTADLNALGAFTANWGDWNLGAGGANLSELNYYGVVYSAAQSWRPEPMTIENYSRAFSLQFFGLDSPEAAEAFTLLARCQGEGITWTTHARMMFHGAPKQQIAAMVKGAPEDLAFWSSLKECAQRAHILLRKSLPKHNADYLRSYDLAARMLEFAGDLALQYRATAEALNSPRFSARKEAKTYEELSARQQAIGKEYRDVYAATNRPINLRYLAIAWEKSKKDLTDFAASLRGGEMPKLQ